MRKLIVYGKVVLIAFLVVVITRTLLVTSCFIPSTGMENTLYKGEGVLVSKWSYGLRMPVQSTFGYYRIGNRPVERGDVVVFNNPMPDDPATSIDNRAVFISRCVGTPGDTVIMNKEFLAIDSDNFSPDTKSLYSYPSIYDEIITSVMSSLNISSQLAGYTPDGDFIRSLSNYEYYLLTQRLDGRVQLTPLYQDANTTFPLVVPQKGVPVKIQPWNAVLLCNMIIFHEKKKAEVSSDRSTILVDGRRVSEYTFSQDFFWMSSDNPINTSDSRLFGFVPESHLIGKAWRIWYPARKGRFWSRVN